MKKQLLKPENDLLWRPDIDFKANQEKLLRRNKMQFPQILKELNKKNKPDLQGSIQVALIYNEENGYTIYTNNQIGSDPFIRSMMLRIKNYISKNYEK